MLVRLFAAIIACCCTAALISAIPTGTIGSTTAGGFGGAANGSPMTNATSITTRPVRGGSEVFGEWDIERFNGYQPASRLIGRERAAFADINKGGISLRLECNTVSVRGDISRARFNAVSEDRVQTPNDCGAERNAREAALFAFIEQNPTVERLSDGRLLMRSGDSELLLDRPINRRIAYIPTEEGLDAVWRFHAIAQTESRTRAQRLDLSDIPGNIIFRSGVMRYDLCPTFDMAFRIDERGQLARIGGKPAPDTPHTCPALAQSDPAMPNPWDAMRVLHDNPELELSGPDALLLTTDNLALTLVKSPCPSVSDCSSPR